MAEGPWRCDFYFFYIGFDCDAGLLLEPVDHAFSYSVLCSDIVFRINSAPAVSCIGCCQRDNAGSFRAGFRIHNVITERNIEMIAFNAFEVVILFYRVGAGREEVTVIFHAQFFRSLIQPHVYNKHTGGERPVWQ